MAMNGKNGDEWGLGPGRGRVRGNNEDQWDLGPGRGIEGME